MYSIGDMSALTGVKVPTIRYYEQLGLIAPAGRSEGNQRRYDARGRDRLRFIRHARALGFPLDAIRSLLALSDDPETPCAEADRIAAAHLADTRARIARLQRLAAELERIATGCTADSAGACRVLDALGDHGQCAGPHGSRAPVSFRETRG